MKMSNIRKEAMLEGEFKDAKNKLDLDPDDAQSDRDSMKQSDDKNQDEHMNVAAEMMPTTPVDHKGSTSITIKNTPAVDKVRQARQMFNIQSPSDAIMSPCTMKLNVGAQKVRRPVNSNPAHVLRSKQQYVIKMNMEEDADKMETESETMDEPSSTNQ